jgi:hypothetical protein
MPVLIVQQGHCFRTSGATGTEGEQAYAVLVADACKRLLQRDGWSVNPTLADENDYRGAAWVAIHCDGSIHPTARGASAGYRTPEGQAFAQSWQRAYAARGWPVFRPDNYTAALSGYYGTKKAVAAGTRRAMIVECGFMTSPQDRELLTGQGGPERVALAIGDALGIAQPAPLPSSTRRFLDMGTYIVKGDSTQPVPGKSYKFGDLQFWFEGDPRVPEEGQRWYTAGSPGQAAQVTVQGGAIVFRQSLLDSIPFAAGGEIPPGVL